MTSAPQIIDRCRCLAQYTEEPPHITRTFLSEPMREVHARIGEWMREAGMRVWIDAAGNIRGRYGAGNRPCLYIGSHLDTVPHAGAFDGILGVIIGIALVGPRYGFDIEVVGFSEEEGVRFGLPFIGSRALIGDLDPPPQLADAIRAFGLDPTRIPEARADENAIGFLEFHIEQGPVLDELGYALAVVDAIAGQSRLTATFHGKANHAGTTPMHLRRDALAGAAEWILRVERIAGAIPGMVATVGQIEAQPGAANVIPGEVRASLDVRHADDDVRHAAVDDMLAAVRPGLTVAVEPQLDQPAVAMDGRLSALFGARHRMTSFAGHDAMIMARRMPAAMLFLRSPSGISHHPDETVLPADVAAALAAGREFLDRLEASRA